MAQRTEARPEDIGDDVAPFFAPPRGVVSISVKAAPVIPGVAAALGVTESEIDDFRGLYLCRKRDWLILVKVDSPPVEYKGLSSGA